MEYLQFAIQMSWFVEQYLMQQQYILVEEYIMYDILKLKNTADLIWIVTIKWMWW